MYWASRRETTRSEDEAYCLMGLFEVNMPLIYGEGRRAFRRLQEAIIIHSPNDQTILAWYDSDQFSRGADLLAERPSSFSLSGDITRPDRRRSQHRGSFRPRQPWGTGMRLTGAYLELPALLYHRSDASSSEDPSCGIRHIVPELADQEMSPWLTKTCTVLVLDCQIGNDPRASPVFILASSGGPNRYNRVVSLFYPTIRPILQLNEPGFLGEAQTWKDSDLNRPTLVEPERLEKESLVLDLCSQHFAGKTIYLSGDIRATSARPYSEEDEAATINCAAELCFWLVFVPSKIITATVTVSDLFPPGEWDNKSLAIRTFISIGNMDRGFPPSEFRVIGAASLKLSGNGSEGLEIDKVALLFGVFPGEREESLWCRLLSSAGDLAGADLEDLAGLDRSHHEPLTRRATLQVSSNLFLSAYIGEIYEWTNRVVGRVWFHNGSYKQTSDTQEESAP